MIFEKKTASLAKMLRASGPFPAALALWSWDKTVRIWLGVTVSFFSFFLCSLVILGLCVGPGIAEEGGCRSRHI